MKKGIKSKRITLMEATEKLEKDQNDDLLLNGQKVSIAYFRSGYRMSDYKDWDAIWKARELI